MSLSHSLMERHQTSAVKLKEARAMSSQKRLILMKRMLPAANQRPHSISRDP